MLVLVGLLTWTGCRSDSPSTPASPPTKDIVEAVSVTQAPVVDGLGGDAAWDRAAGLKVPTEGGPEVTVKSVISGDRIYFLASWKDETNDAVDEVWQFDGQTWQKGLIDDAFAILFNTDNSIKGFNKEGCQILCHKEGADPSAARMLIEGSASGRDLWSGRSQRGDLWDISLGVSNVRGEVNDYYFGIDPIYLQHPAAIQPTIFRQHDQFINRAPFIKNYQIDPTDGKTKPKYRLKEGLTVENTPYPLTSQVEPITDYSVFNPGDRIPYMLFESEDDKWGGSRDDIKGKGVWKDGQWTVEINRKLDTGHDDDIQFKVPREGTNYYVLALAVFDRTIVSHNPSRPVSLAISSLSEDSGSAAKSKMPVVKGVRSDTAPKLDGQGKDKVWSKAPETSIPTDGAAEAKIKTIYTKDRIYFLVSWADLTPQDGKLYWGFDGEKWERRYELDDKIAFLWNIDHSVKGFDQDGCQAICHDGHMVIQEGNMVGGKVWSGAYQKADAWKWAPGVMQEVHVVDDGIFSVDDAFLDSPKSFSTARIYLRFDNGDAGTKQWFTRNPRNKNMGGEDNPYPTYQLKPGLTFETTPFPNRNQMEEITDYSVFKAGDKIPMLTLFDLEADYNKERFPEGKPSGSRVDLKGYGTWQDGWWTLEFERKLNTGHDDDVQFMSKKGKLISGNVFDLALFNDTRFGHTWSGPVTLKLE